jgi:hypothetical protein
MLVGAVLNVGDPFEAGSEAAPDLLLADKAAPPGIGPSGGFKDAVFCEVGHDGVQVMSVEGVQDLTDDLALALVVHTTSLVATSIAESQHSLRGRVNPELWMPAPPRLDRSRDPGSRDRYGGGEPLSLGRQRE